MTPNIDARRLAETLRAVASHFLDAAYELNTFAGELFAANPREQRSDDVLMNTPIDELELSVRSTNCLRKIGVETVGQLAAVRRAEFDHIPHFGVRSRKEVLEVMTNLGLALREP